MQTQERSAGEDEQNRTFTSVKGQGRKSHSELQNRFPRCVGEHKRTHTHYETLFTSGGEEISSSLCAKPINTLPNRVYSLFSLSKSPVRCWMTSGSLYPQKHLLQHSRIISTKNTSVEMSTSSENRQCTHQSEVPLRAGCTEGEGTSSSQWRPRTNKIMK